MPTGLQTDPSALVAKIKQLCITHIFLIQLRLHPQAEGMHLPNEKPA
jgi:hypothetical protein